MPYPDERICNPVSMTELERRWAAARAAMREAKLDALVIQGACNAVGTGGYFRWFTGVSPIGSYPQTVIFPAEGLMSLVMHGPLNGDHDLRGEDATLPGIGRRLTTPHFPAIGYAKSYDAELVAREIMQRGFRAIGLVALNQMVHGSGAALERRLVGLEVRDATDLIDPLKAVKSAEEVALIRRTAAMQDEVLKRAMAHLRPGMKDFEIMAYSHYQGQLLGSETGYMLGSSSPVGQPAFIRPRPQQGRELRAGDTLFLQAETTGPGGMFVHIGRLVVLGKAPQELVDAWGMAVEAQDFTVGLLKPGALCRDIFAAYQSYLRARKLPEETRLHCHGQGYDVVERPLIRHDESMMLAAGMNIGIHPSWTTPRYFITVCDNFLIGADGTVERLHKTPRAIVEL
ncbi:MAG TPA: M24 family metallopeptidase [Stellaceae bacterium]|nr:M24 family metallopeptidase [Stellaceae bacterium]